MESEPEILSPPHYIKADTLLYEPVAPLESMEILSGKCEGAYVYPASHYS